jgi:hypothetical protein
MTRSGDGTAVLEASLIPTIEEFPGKWTSQKGLVSSSYTKLQGKDYYIDYSYVVVSNIQFQKYKQVLKELLHPAGLIAYSEVTKLDEIEETPVKVYSEISQGSV